MDQNTVFSQAESANSVQTFFVNLLDMSTQVEKGFSRGNVRGS
jgi:hypothetical protein